MLAVGLGNPGEKYQNTPHNIGFEIVENFARKNNFPEFSFSQKTHSLVSKKDDVVLIKPQTFMNKSGLAVKAALGFWKESQVIAIHDDIDLPFGEIKIAENRGSAGHKGVESTIQEIGNKEFIRIRVGIRPEKRVASPEKFVLQKFNQKEQEIRNIIEKSVNALGDVLKKGTEKAMTLYN